jgi:CRISPR-associated DxTHG motif protein
MKLITFLGITDYEEVEYRWHDLSKPTKFVQEALVRWLQPETTCVLLTKEARKKHWGDLCQRLQRHTQTVEGINIPDGKSEEELWEIFAAISKAVQEGDEIVFDITHGFRSLPMIALLTIAYLKQVKGVKVQHVVYGVYEKGKHEAPILDLTPFANLLDWLAAAKMFMATGDSSELGRLIQEVQNDAYRNRGAYGENLPRALKNFGMALEEVSNDLLLARVPNLPDSIRRLAQRQSEANTEVGQWTQPLTLLLDKIAAAYAPFQDDSLPTQAKLIRWYLNHNHIVQAMTLAREWVVSYYAQQKSLSRDDAEDELNQRANNQENDELVQLWSSIRNIRNDLAHCGFGRAEGQVLSAASIRQNAEEVVKQVERLARQEAVDC